MKALNNPYIVGALALVSLYFVYRSVFKKPVHAVPPSETSEKAKKEKEGAPGLSQKKIDISDAQWLTSVELQRNPFNLSAEEEHKMENDEERDRAGAAPQSDRSELQVSAIWIDDQRKFAVINGRVVKEGERILGYEVGKILANRIFLHGAGGSAVIGLSSAPKPQLEPVARKDHDSNAGSSPTHLP